MNKELQSYHIFLFPFKWEIKGGKNKLSFSERNDISRFFSLLKTHENYGKSYGNSSEKFVWEHQPFKLDRADKYNEFNYFYDYVQEILYDLDNDLQPSDHINALHHFEFILPKKSTYQIDLTKWVYKDGVKVEEKDGYPKTYILEIESILLNIYNTGVGVMSFHLKNYDFSNEQAILDINQFGRRIYPPFLGNFMKNQPLGDVKGGELADRISICCAGKEWGGEDFSMYEDPDNFRKSPFRLPGFISKPFEGVPLYCKNDTPNSQSSFIEISPVVDDRMFVLCWSQNEQVIKFLGQSVNEFSKNNSWKELNHVNDYWYKYLFIDANYPNCGDPKMFQDLLREHTYKRWLVPEGGTAYGVTRYSFVSLMAADDPIYRGHVTGMYYKMIELSLVQRVSVLKFSDEVTHLSNLERSGKSINELSNDIRRLYNAYIHFVNKIYFREITAQEQGIELYDMMQKNMRLEEQVEDLEKEIGELHQYATLLEEKKRNDQLQVLTILATIFLVPSFFTSFFGMNLFDGKLQVDQGVYFKAIFFITLFTVLTMVLMSLISNIVVKPKRWYLRKFSDCFKFGLFEIILLLTLMTLIAFLYSYSNS